jgi:tetratricopeptide (TPR) repeat protein
MTEGIKREDAGRIISKLHECRMYLQKDNVYSCLLSFKEVIEKMRSTKMLPQDEKVLRTDINAFQLDLSESKGFRKLYGPVTFTDDDLDTAYDFMKQLIQIKEEEILDAMEKAKNEEAAVQETLQQRIDKIMIFVEREDYETARKMAAEDDDAAEALIEIYNTSGIRLRQEQDFEKAVEAFRKALSISPEDEGLYYNMSRAFIEAGDWPSAKNTMEEALGKFAEFKEGIDLLAFINKNIS